MHGTVRKKNKRFLLRIRDELPRRIPIRISARSGKFGSLLLPGWLLAGCAGCNEQAVQRNG